MFLLRVFAPSRFNSRFRAFESKEGDDATETTFDAYWAGVDDDLEPLSRSGRAGVTATPDCTPYAELLCCAADGDRAVPPLWLPYPSRLRRQRPATPRSPAYTPRYGSVNNPPHTDDRERYVVFTLMHRGQRLADRALRRRSTRVCSPSALNAPANVHLPRDCRGLHPGAGVPARHNRRWTRAASPSWGTISHCSTAARRPQVVGPCRRGG